eukprot:CAMPEP_0114620200 /NCGR_PEP_ID=MMETSP0168-20121206/8604_1 /TAXON_ID=95228 ORGANISM="Vannella sp., Strain DIVA3 517/6/12" /NCGR_SAMPLE_ID=MMETSP0168 /ASSEMBLY_ACC=CAM_ASM_000044 /LENGTH=73 /DNA_ID=CAMNT_0001831387 /DNA_START=193 /DNA_END=410 /DNA_ORIENTATION=-
MTSTAISTNFATVNDLSSKRRNPKRWWGTPAISSCVGLFVAMSRPSYTCMESMFTTSPPRSFASSTASLLLPT